MFAGRQNRKHDCPMGFETCAFNKVSHLHLPSSPLSLPYHQQANPPSHQRPDPHPLINVLIPLLSPTRSFLSSHQRAQSSFIKRADLCTLMTALILSSPYRSSPSPLFNTLVISPSDKALVPPLSKSAFTPPHSRRAPTPPRFLVGSRDPI